MTRPEDRRNARWWRNRTVVAGLVVVALLLTGLGAAIQTAPSAPVPDKPSEHAPSTRVHPRLADRLEAAPSDETVEAIVMMEDRVDRDTVRDAREIGLDVMPPLRSIPSVFAIRGTPSQVQPFLDQDDVRYARGNEPIEMHLDTSRTAVGAESVTGHLPGRGGPITVDGETVDGTGVGIAVVDSGIDATHPDLAYGDEVVQNRKFVCTTPFLVSVSTQYCYGNWVVNNPDFDDGLCTSRDDPLWVETRQSDTSSGHGTHVASTAAGTGDAGPEPGQFRGVAPGAKLYGLGVGEAGLLFDVLSALDWVACHANDVTPEIKVVNNSWGLLGCNEGGPGPIEETIIDEMVAEGVTVVFSAGNDGGDGSEQCSSTYASTTTPGVIMVASYDDQDRGAVNATLSASSSRGDADNATTWPDVSAPGSSISAARAKDVGVSQAVGVVLADPRDPVDYMQLSGTSMAAPHVSGVVALLLDADPSLTPAEIEDVIEDTAVEFDNGVAYEPDPHNDDGKSSYDKGHGLVDARAALKAVAAANATLTLGDTPASEAPLAGGSWFLRTGPTGVGNVDAEFFGWNATAPTKTTPSVWRDPVVFTNFDTFWIPARKMPGAVDLDGVDVTVTFWSDAAPAAGAGFDKWEVTLQVGNVEEAKTVSAPISPATGPVEHTVTWTDVTAEDRSLGIVFDSAFVNTNSDNALLYDSTDTPTSLEIG